MIIRGVKVAPWVRRSAGERSLQNVSPSGFSPASMCSRTSATNSFGYSLGLTRKPFLCFGPACDFASAERKGNRDECSFRTEARSFVADERPVTIAYHPLEYIAFFEALQRSA